MMTSLLFQCECLTFCLTYLQINKLQIYIVTNMGPNLRATLTWLWMYRMFVLHLFTTKPLDPMMNLMLAFCNKIYSHMIKILSATGNGSFRFIFMTTATKKFITLQSSLGIILGMGSANERQCYIVTSSSIGWSHN